MQLTSLMASFLRGFFYDHFGPVSPIMWSQVFDHFGRAYRQRGLNGVIYTSVYSGYFDHKSQKHLTSWSIKCDQCGRNNFTIKVGVKSLKRVKAETVFVLIFEGAAPKSLFKSVSQR